MVNSDEYTPAKGDIVWIDFNPQRGHEQRGRRPALVVSHKSYNEKIGLALFGPITSKVKGYPFEVAVEGEKVSGCVLSDQVKSLDWHIRRIEFIEEFGEHRTEQVIQKIVAMIM